MPEISTWVLISIMMLLLAWIGFSLKRVRRLEKKLAETSESRYGEIIRTVDHHRHDWMNDVQVLFGYIQLNKREKLLVYINQIVEQMRLESLISKLGIPFLVAYVVSFRANTNALILHVRLEQEISLNKYGEQGLRVARLMVDFIEVYKSAAGHGEGEANELLVTMNVWDDQLFIEFEYDGFSDIMRIRDNLQKIIERIQAEQDINVTTIDTEQSMDIEIRVSLGIV